MEHGDADLVISHYKKDDGRTSTKRFVMTALGHWPKMLFSNTAVIVGPATDPAGTFASRAVPCLPACLPFVMIGSFDDLMISLFEVAVSVRVPARYGFALTLHHYLRRRLYYFWYPQGFEGRATLQWPSVASRPPVPSWTTLMWTRISLRSRPSGWLQGAFPLVFI
jgi:hypothetical protein